MALKSKSKFQDLLIYAGLIAICIAVVVAIGFMVRWLSAASVQDRVVSPRAGIECLVVSASDGVGVSCYQIPGAGK